MLPPNPAIPRRLLINPAPDLESLCVCVCVLVLGTYGLFLARFVRALIAASWVVLSLSPSREICGAVGMGCFGCFAPEANEGSDDLKPSKPNYHSSDDSSGADARRKVTP